MRERLIYLLKHNRFLQAIYRFVMSAVFRIWGLFLKIDSNLAIFVSFMGKGFNDSPKAIFDEICKREDLKDIKCVWAFENPEKYPQLCSVKIDTVKYFRLALKAKYWITNTNIERGLKFKKKKTIYLNTWHGVALKKIGNDCPGRGDYDFNSVNYLCVSGEHDKKVFKSAFQAKEETFLECGMPRNDELWTVSKEKVIDIRQQFGVSPNKKIILYAPTWRDSLDAGRSYAINPPIDFEKWKKILKNDYVIFFRAHTITTQIMGIVFDDFIMDVSEYPEVNDLMMVSDLLITDYSAIAFDYAILEKPILCFAYDYDSYLKERGTYFDIDQEYPNKACRDEETLLDRIVKLDYLQESQNTAKFKSKFVEYGKNATVQCVDKLFDEI